MGGAAETPGGNGIVMIGAINVYTGIYLIVEDIETSEGISSSGSSS